MHRWPAWTLTLAVFVVGLGFILTRFRLFPPGQKTIVLYASFFCVCVGVLWASARYRRWRNDVLFSAEGPFPSSDPAVAQPLPSIYPLRVVRVTALALTFLAYAAAVVWIEGWSALPAALMDGAFSAMIGYGLYRDGRR